MDITTATTTGLALVSVLSVLITQVTKKYIPEDWRPLFAAGVSGVLAIISLALTGGLSAGAEVPALITAVIGTAQAIYAAVNKITSGKLSTDSAK